jgi:nucleoside-diphosphate-sugar epimerase
MTSHYDIARVAKQAAQLVEVFMRLFITGASGWIGSASVRELLAAGHDVVGLARSDSAAAAVARLGAEVHRGSLDDVESWRPAASRAEGIVHLAYQHDFSQMAASAAMDRRAVDAFGDILAGTGAPLIVASGVLGMGSHATELDSPDPSLHPRIANGAAALALAERGVRPCLVRFAPTVHGQGDRGFMATLAELAHRAGVSAYVDDGAGRWPAVHRLDAAALVRLAVEVPDCGPVVHAVAEEGIATREIADAIGRSVGVPTESIPAARAAEHFGWIGGFFALDAAASSALTRQRTGWDPTRPGLIADINAGSYENADPNSVAGTPVNT